MAEIFEITDAIRDLARASISDLYSQLSKQCILVYPPKTVPCSNCADSFGNKPGNSFVHGGPSNLSNMNCSLCGGTGYKSEVVTEEVQLKLNFNVSTIKGLPLQTFQNLSRPVDMKGILQAKGFIELIPKILKCEYMIAQTPITGYIEQKYKLLIPPCDTSNIAQNHFFVSYWERV